MENNISRNTFTRALLCVAAFLPVTEGFAEVTLPQVISSHMVLQRDLAAPIWGKAVPGEKVTVSFRTQVKTATADAAGQWMVKLDPLKAGGPDTMKIAGANTITLDDVLVGEVWFGSGQSNMGLNIREAAGADPALAAAAGNAFPKIRLIITAGATGWQQSNAETNVPFSALLLAFGMSLQKELDVPVGLILGAVGATPSGDWISKQAFESDPACKAAVQKFTTTTSASKEGMQRFVASTILAAPKHKYRYAQGLEAWEKAYNEAKKDGKPLPPRPPLLRREGLKGGIVGTYYETRVRPVIPYGIRGVLWDQGESSTAIDGVDQFTLMGALIRSWRKDWALPATKTPDAPGGDFPFIYVQKFSGCGCAWDDQTAVNKGARKFSPLPAEPPSTYDGLYNENHVMIMQYPKTAMAISSDLSPGLHPPNKLGYGIRCAQVAMNMAYGAKAEIYGPTYQSHKIEGQKVRITFAHLDQGLAMRHADKLQGFAVAGEDKVFHWADAVIDGKTVIVSCDKVKSPVAVRYAWGQEYPWANLFNKAFLPALPFRTDTW